MSIHVLICDDDPIVREALAGYVDRDPGLEVVAVVDNAEDALERLTEPGTDVVLMDLALPGMDGITATRIIRTRRPDVAVLMLTTFGTDEQVKEAIGAGAAGFLLKSTSAAALVAAVRTAATRAGTVITPELASHLAISAMTPEQAENSGPRAADAAESLGLTEREAEVLELLCAAESNAGIASTLKLSESTVKSHVSSLMTKLNCTSRLQIAVRAFERGLVTPPRPSL
ncbi:response regulator transcription factor [Brachybacterium timonense]|uniref:response regulator transcription factor n=1 Tax=Brachybacterium timonense TaxID=2050896 RepID=UPI000D0B212A|nr:response regulator transcription factor [Brachybacterium timonense]